MISYFFKYLFLFNIVFLFSQSADEIEILSVKIDGNNRFSDDDVARHTKLYPGMRITGDDIQQIIKKVWIPKVNPINTGKNAKERLKGSFIQPLKNL